MTMPDPFNPRPGPLPGQDHHDMRRGVEPQDGGKSFLWVPLGILGAVGLLIFIAAL